MNLYALESEEILASTVRNIRREITNEKYSEVVDRLWRDRNYLLGRLKLIGEDLSSEDSNPKEVIAEWATEAVAEVQKPGKGY